MILLSWANHLKAGDASRLCSKPPSANSSSTEPPVTEVGKGRHSPATFRGVQAAGGASLST